MVYSSLPQPFNDQGVSNTSFTADSISAPQLGCQGPLSSIPPNVMPVQQGHSLCGSMLQPNLFNREMPLPQLNVTEQDFHNYGDNIPAATACSSGTTIKLEDTNVPNLQHQFSAASDSIFTQVEEANTPPLMNLISFESSSTEVDTPVSFPSHTSHGYSLPLQEFSEMTVEPKANKQVFEDFKLADVESSFLDETDCQILKNYLSVLVKLLSVTAKPEKVTEMKITCFRKTDDNDSEYSSKAKTIASFEGFRVLSKVSKLGTPYEVSKFGPVNLECFKLPAPDQLVDFLMYRPNLKNNVF